MSKRGHRGSIGAGGVGRPKHMKGATYMEGGIEHGRHIATPNANYYVLIWRPGFEKPEIAHCCAIRTEAEDRYEEELEKSSNTYCHIELTQRVFRRMRFED